MALGGAFHVRASPDRSRGLGQLLQKEAIARGCVRAIWREGIEPIAQAPESQDASLVEKLQHAVNLLTGGSRSPGSRK